ncbi:hypothetical protein ACMD2_05174 [Ananas comosus]|uniref:Uncharacterized protein n=1 Tax=Ananas comosus TaxID=4615 RepID=A0A199W0V8_ANACO|nr:hypothetical protein ACMD2_05174 [Ananas comosus]
MGSPATTPSSVEFHPQCVMNPPTAGCDRIATCGAQPFIIRPLSLTLSSNPSAFSHSSTSANLSPALITHTNGLSEASNPNALPLAAVSPTLLLQSDRGPRVQIFFPAILPYASTYEASKSSKVFTTIPSALLSSANAASRNLSVPGPPKFPGALAFASSNR